MIYSRQCVRWKWTCVAKAVKWANDELSVKHDDLGKVEPSVYSDSKEYAFLSCHLLDIFDIFIKIMILNILAVW